MKEKWDLFWLWKRFGLNRCDICNKLCLLQHEVGIGYWTCSNVTCLEKATERALTDYYVWNNEKGYGTFDFSEKHTIEYK